MKFQLRRLTLHCRKSTEGIDFSPHVTVFHGPISAGKSSIARLVDFCLGGDLERTPAIAQELVSAELLTDIGEFEVIFAREAKGSNRVRVTWRSPNGDAGTVLAPLSAESTAIWRQDIFSLSDLIFYFMGLPVLKVRRSAADPDAPMVRLSFRDILWYCYLDQDNLDSSFFRLEDSMRGPKSKNVMRFLVGYYTERMNALEGRIAESSRDRAHKLGAAIHVRTFLESSGVGTEVEVATALERTKAELVSAQAALNDVRAAHSSKTHVADDTRQQLRSLSDRLETELKALQDLSERVSEQKALRAECLSARFKTARTDAAASVLTGVTFELCPACGTSLSTRAKILEKGECYLCHQVPARVDAHPAEQLEIARRDLDERIEDLEESIERHSKSHVHQGRIADGLRKEKLILEARLEEELRAYDSVYLARFRDSERRVALLEERIKGMDRLRAMFTSIAVLEKEADQLGAEEQGLRRELEAERKSIKTAADHVKGIEQAYLDALIRVGVPGVNRTDKIHLNPTTWIPWILPGGDEAIRYSFGNAGSGGKKTLLNVCYATSVHLVCAERQLPLPRLLMIDTPMKNIGEDVNRDLFVSFYRYLYELAAGPLSDTQFLIIDKEFIDPGDKGVQLVERYMTPSDDKYPPLISYYRGP